MVPPPAPLENYPGIKMPPSPRPSPISRAFTSGRACLLSQGTAAGSRKSLGHSEQVTPFGLGMEIGGTQEEKWEGAQGRRTPPFSVGMLVQPPAAGSGLRFSLHSDGEEGWGEGEPRQGQRANPHLPPPQRAAPVARGLRKGRGRRSGTKAEARLGRRGGEAGERASEEVGWRAAGESSSGIGAPRQALFSGPRPLSLAGAEGPPRQPLPSPGCGGRRGRPFPGIV